MVILEYSKMYQCDLWSAVCVLTPVNDLVCIYPMTGWYV